jgi:hypothetical protein
LGEVVNDVEQLGEFRPLSDHRVNIECAKRFVL